MANLPAADGPLERAFADERLIASLWAPGGTLDRLLNEESPDQVLLSGSLMQQLVQEACILEQIEVGSLDELIPYVRGLIDMMSSDDQSAADSSPAQLLGNAPKGDEW